MIRMREIKFRAWESETELGKLGNMSYNQEFCFAMILHPDGIELMQYTGLKDKNGKEIYEGDILLGHPYCFNPVIVYWEQGQCGWEVKDCFDNVYSHFIDWSGEGDLGYQPFEIIGNIYENPELLGVQNETCSS